MRKDLMTISFYLGKDNPGTRFSKEFLKLFVEDEETVYPVTISYGEWTGGNDALYNRSSLKCVRWLRVLKDREELEEEMNSSRDLRQLPTNFFRKKHGTSIDLFEKGKMEIPKNEAEECGIFTEREIEKGYATIEPDRMNAFYSFFIRCLEREEEQDFSALEQYDI